MAYTAAQKLVTRRQKLVRISEQITRLNNEKEILEADVARLAQDEAPTTKEWESEEAKLMLKLEHLRALKGLKGGTEE